MWKLVALHMLTFPKRWKFIGDGLGSGPSPKKIINNFFKGKLWSERVFYFYGLIRHILKELKNRAQKQKFFLRRTQSLYSREVEIHWALLLHSEGEIAIKRQLERREKGQQTQPFFPHNNNKTKCLGMRKSLAEFMGKRRNESCRISPPSQKSRRNTRQ